MARSTQVKKRNYIFVINNYTAKDEEYIQSLKCKYIVYGREIAPSTGTPHLQGYIMFENARSFNSVKKIFSPHHIEIAKGSPLQNWTYCTEDGDVFEKGVKPKGAGSRSDIKQVRELVSNGANMRTILDSDITSYQGIRYAETLLKYFEKPRDWLYEVYWCYGVSGSGKTRWCVQECKGDYWMSNKTLKWWEGYDGHENVIIDEFRKDFCTLHELLRVLDRYPYRIEVKGSSRQLLAKRIYITSCYRPEDVYNTHEDVYQLLRRITRVIHFIKDLDTDT